MAKDPAFLFYSSDFLTGTMFMTNEQVGLYMRLLCAQHQHGGRIDTNVLRSQCESITNGGAVYAKFEHDEAGSYSVRLDEEMKKRKEKSIKARESVNNRWNKNLFDGNTNVLRSVNENECENEIKEPEKKEPEPEKPKQKKPEIPSELEFMAYYKSELSKEFPGLEFSIKTKYETWLDQGWKDGNDKKIGNWKLKLKNTIPHLKAKFDPNKPASGPISFSSKTMHR